MMCLAVACGSFDGEKKVVLNDLDNWEEELDTELRKGELSQSRWKDERDGKDRHLDHSDFTSSEIKREIEILTIWSSLTERSGATGHKIGAIGHKIKGQI
ncbi:hypothetical protein TIFTF001_040644 [Ficus carica]|uniref:Uncharacterized protein n=1 Tax=Ficus carica TaxID=3494 RepID=A0AA87Z5T8_FICCA|nr:hypothetical protein TIFTF001_040644 [Ficus carica]